MPRLRTLAPALAALLVPLAACPQAAQAPPETAQTPPLVSADDKRVVADTSDLYPADATAGRATPSKEATARAPGSGRPDETNGKCRLYAPELPSPECCARELGFSVETVKQACGLKLYLGESFHATCGYYFLADATASGEPAKWFRLSTIRGATPRDAAASHDEYTRKLSKDPNFASVPIPGITGAYWSSQDDLHWAFIPGWSSVRQFTWHDGACSEEGIREILEQLVAAPEIPANAQRTSLVPGAPPAAASAPADTAAPAGSAAPAGPAGSAAPAGPAGSAAPAGPAGTAAPAGPAGIAAPAGEKPAPTAAG